MKEQTANSIIACWQKIIGAYGDSSAVMFNGGSDVLSFRDLDREADRLHGCLPPFAAGSVVALAQRDPVKWLTGFLALKKGSYCILAVDGSMPGSVLRGLLATAGASAVMTDDCIETLAGGVTVPAETTLLKVTSGTSSCPKLVPFSDSAAISDARNVCRSMGIGSDDINLAILPLGHSYALGNLVVPLVTRGIPLSIGSSHLPSAIEHDLGWSKATVLASVPRVWASLCGSTVQSLGSLRLAISAAAPLQPATALEFRRRFNLCLHNFYGSSETGGIAYDRTGQAGLYGTGVGTALEGVTLEVTDEGLLAVTSHAVSHSLGRQCAGGRTVVPGDRARICRDGTVQLLGRADRVVKISGHRIDLGAVEDLLRVELCTDGVACIPSHRAEQLALFIPPGMSSVASRAIASLYPSFRRRFVIREVPSIPVTRRGKVDYRRLEQGLAGGG